MKQKTKQSSRITLGFIATAIYLAAVVCAPFFLNAVPNSANEWGDYFAGFLAPVAIVWFIATLVLQRNEMELQRHELELQREELALQRKEMELTRGVLGDQNEIQLRTAEANLEANQIAAKTQFIDSVPKHIELLDLCIADMKALPRKFSKLNGGTTNIGSPEDLDRCLGYFLWKNNNVSEIEKFKLTEMQWDTLVRYKDTFGEFRDESIKTDNQIHIRGRHSDLYELIRDVMRELEVRT